MKTVILKDGAGNPQGVIRELPGDQQRLYDCSGSSIATYRRRTDHTYDNNGSRLGSGNRLAGMIDQDEIEGRPQSWAVLSRREKPTDCPSVPLSPK